MNILLTIKLAIRGLLVNKIRAFLTILGIIIGVSGIILIISVGHGAESLIVNQIKSVGTNLIGILPGGREEDEPPAALFGIVITTLKSDDMLAVKELPNVIAVSAYNKSVEQIWYKNRKTESTINGVFSAYPIVEDAVIAEGRFFTEVEDGGLAKVVVLGSAAKEELFGDGDPIGERIKIRNQNFKVVGVFEERGVTGFVNNDSHVFIPSRTMQKLVLGIDHIGFGRIKIDDADNVDASMESIENLIRVRHGIDNPEDDDFSVASQGASLVILGNVTGSINLFLTAIAAIALIVGGIGIMNVMFIAVTERTHEIGLRKALGAQRADIIKQFLVEAVTITSLGGIIGIVLGVATSLAVAFVIQQLGYDWDFIVTFNSVFVALIVIAGIGIVFGYAPAKKAAEKRAIEALRYE